MLIGAAALKLESEGPAIFKQKRIGKDGKEINKDWNDNELSILINNCIKRIMKEEKRKL